MKILTVLGARPQFIKAGAVSRAIKQFNSGKEIVDSGKVTVDSDSEGENKKLSLNTITNANTITEIIVHTGQHYDYNMSDVFFEELDLPKPDYYLGIGGKSHGAMTGEMIIKLEEVMLKEKPDVVLVYGDTNSTLAGAIAASKLHIPIAHVEAGLRSFNMKMPEEINRVLTDRVSKWLFCPTDTAVENLKKEGFPFKLSTNNYQLISNVGDVMYDVALYYKQFAKKPLSLFTIHYHSPLSTITNHFILCTIHREENTDNIERLKNIFEAIEEISKEIPVILPLHPRTKKIIENNNINPKNVITIEPVSYLEMIWLLDNCKMVMTDSGGLQKEAYFFKKPCITLRDETEWVELVEIGANILAGAEKEKILGAYRKFTNNLPLTTNHYPLNLYGDGRASGKIVGELINE
ncbi:UDP-N-acetylglucosamine 2-epimerase (non-hydrolyzing) [Venenivibrio stagnispumantis]|uniref:UDP-GlcNAc3NAcA epimerase n=1 Tax=Venenivibrio stagnispumantis TaxID=407998 RepID=A0AA46AF42_9AQUI|nr:UDP-N-acetylglucosamine 2-epimerase (non-hydrolyzing) [Venenivibrio stagnispumantis]MCW4573207.1 UDP-N-acetylglucosamine 2-epimerase (non-hydrolyzing) [Venenivibrio stagnispumantis]SMP17368.1 UDP-GlcNAc3NAcA epimerase [Venenivibrio stagnispumantis]